MFQEKDFEDIISKYPELIEEGLILIGRQLTIYGRRMDLLLEDKFKRKLIIELKIGPIKDVHIGQVLSYEGMLLSAEDPSIRIMLVGNRVPPNIQRSLDHHGIAWREITLSYLKEFLFDKKDETFLNVLGDEEPITIKKTLNRDKELQVEKSKVIQKSASSVIIYEQIKEILNDKVGSIVSSSQVKELLYAKNRTNASSIILSDYCYNRINVGIKFNKHIFEYIDRNTYKYLGENYPFTGLIFSKPLGEEKELVVGEWKNGVKFLNEIPVIWIGLDQSKYSIEHILENQKAGNASIIFLKSFHEEMTQHLNRMSLSWIARTHKIGITYLCNEKKAFMFINVFQHFFSVKYFIGNSKIEGMEKGTWVNKDDNLGSKPFRVVNTDSQNKAVHFALKAYKIAIDWTK